MDSMDSPILVQDGRSTHAIKEHLSGKTGAKDGSRGFKGAGDEKNNVRFCASMAQDASRRHGAFVRETSAFSLNRMKRNQAATSRAHGLAASSLNEWCKYI